MEEEIFSQEVGEVSSYDASLEIPQEEQINLEEQRNQDDEDLGLIAKALEQGDDAQQDQFIEGVSGEDPYRLKAQPSDYSFFMQSTSTFFRDRQPDEPITVADLGKLAAAILGTTEGYLGRVLPDNFIAMTEVQEKIMQDRLESSKKQVNNNLLSTRLELDTELQSISRDKEFVSKVRELGLEEAVVGALREGDKPKILKLYRELKGKRRSNGVPSGSVGRSRSSNSIDLDEFAKRLTDGKADIRDLL
ncbi:MAG: hypothetical protein [Caudoviricetes sp.]|nr:MAG: hypothetical protein [Caudoviricetes sp.]